MEIPKGGPAWERRSRDRAAGLGAGSPVRASVVSPGCRRHPVRRSGGREGGVWMEPLGFAERSGWNLKDGRNRGRPRFFCSPTWWGLTRMGDTFSPRAESSGETRRWRGESGGQARDRAQSQGGRGGGRRGHSGPRERRPEALSPGLPNFPSVIKSQFFFQRFLFIFETERDRA